MQQTGHGLNSGASGDKMQYMLNNTNSYDGNTGQRKPENLLQIIEFDNPRGDGNYDNRHATGAGLEQTMRDGTPCQQCEFSREVRKFEDQYEQRGPYSPPTPPHTPQKNQQPSFVQGNLRRDEKAAHLNVPNIAPFNQQIKKLSPLSISVDQPWVPVSPRFAEKETKAFPTRESSQPPPSPSVRLSFHFDDGFDPSDLSQEKKDKLAKAVNDILCPKSDEDLNRQMYSGDAQIQKPFPLQAPPKAKLKRQLSSDSNDSMEIRSSVKSPSKRQTTYDSSRENFQKFPQGSCSTTYPPGRDTDYSLAEQNILRRPAYADNIQWFLEKQSPTSEEDFRHVKAVEKEQGCLSSENTLKRFSKPGFGNMHGSLSASHILSDKLNEGCRQTLRQSMSCADLNIRSPISSLQQPDPNCSRNWQKENIETFNKEILSNVNQTDGRQCNAAVISSQVASNPLVTEKGFIFPPKANVTNPVPFSPRIVHPRVSPSKMSSGLMQGEASNISKFPLRSRNDPYIPQQEKIREKSNYDQTRDFCSLSTEEMRKLKYILRSQSAIESSPSKKEIEEIREIMNRTRRSLSDPSASPQNMKNMMYVEKILESLNNQENYSHTSTHSPIKNNHENVFSENVHYQENCSHFESTYGRRRPSMHCGVKRELFKYGNMSDQDSTCPASPRTKTVIPDVIASVLTSHNVMSPDEIANVNRNRSNTSRQVAASDIHQSETYCSNMTSPGFNRNIKGCNVVDTPSEMFQLGQNCNKLSYEHPHQMCGRYQNFSSLSRNSSTSERGFQQYSPLPKSPPVSYVEREPKRQRKTGDIEMRVSCEEFREKNHHLQEHFEQFEHSGKTCKCENVENEILLMARDAYNKLRRVDESKEALEQFDREVQITNNSIFDAMEILCSIKCLCKYGRTIEDICSGSILFTINCPTLASLDDLWSCYTSKEIEKIFNKDFEDIKVKYSNNIHLAVNISADEYMQSRKELELKESIVPLDTSLGNTTLTNSSMSKSDTEICSIGSAKENNPIIETKRFTSLAYIHVRSQSAPITRNPTPVSSPSWLAKSPKSPLSRERKFSFSNNAELSPRKAFQELNIGKDVPCSPTMKKLFEFDITLSPKTSPKRKTFAESPPWEHENMHPELVSPKRKNFELKESIVPLDTSLGNTTLTNSSMSKSDTEICSIGSAKENNPIIETKRFTSLAYIHVRSQSAPITRNPTPVSSPSWLAKSPKSPLSRERKFSFSNNAELSPRKAFQELNIGKDVPCSPTMKKLFEFDITLSPKTSPKRKTFAESPPWEHENMHPELVSPKRKNFGNSFPFSAIQGTNRHPKGSNQEQ